MQTINSGDLMKKVKEFIIVFGIGSFLYALIEVLFRGWTHWSMFLAGGIIFYSLYIIFNKMESDSILLKCIIGCAVITAVEYLAGFIVNIIFKMDVWDYSDRPFNLFGQICLLFSIGWFFISIPVWYFSKGLRRKLNET